MDRTIRLNDPLNLRDLIAKLTDHIRLYGAGEASPKNIVGFFALILTGADTGETRKDNRITTMQRLLSGNIPYGSAAVQALAGEICSGERDGPLLESLEKLARAIRECAYDGDLIGDLYEQCSFRFFSPEELQTLRFLHLKGDTPRFLLVLLKHAFATLYNIPCFFAQRMYDEAITCDWDSPHRYALMKLAADSGNRDAAMEYANFLARRYGQSSDADRYFLLALPKPEAVWSLANRIELRWVGEDRVPEFRRALRIEDKLGGPEFAAFREELEGVGYGGPEPERAETMLFLYKVYFYLAYQDFFKGFHSMAKQLETGTICFSGPGGEAKTLRLRLKYRAAAIRASNVISFLSEGNRALRQLTAEEECRPDPEEEGRMLELLGLAADTDLLYGNLYLGEYYEYRSRREPQLRRYRETAKEYYLRAERLDTNGDGRGGRLWLRLGVVSDTPEEKRLCFEKALEAGEWDAAYYLAEMESKLYLSGGKTSRLHLFSAAKLLKDHLSLISKDNAELAKLLYRALVSAIEAEERQDKTEGERRRSGG